jgi:DNA modification methylase
MAGKTPFHEDCITNDINPALDTKYHCKARYFLQKFHENSVDLVIFDPPYSPTQMKRSYDSYGYELVKEDANANFTPCKELISRIVRPGGYCISCNWNSTGIGQSRGFRKIEILLVNHGGSHHDTIVLAERKGI